MSEKRYLFDASVAKTITAGATMEIICDDTLTIASVSMSAAGTLNLSADSNLNPGDRLVVIATSDGTGRNLTFGTSITGPVLAGVANKTKTQEFIYTGSAFVAVGAPVQID